MEKLQESANEAPPPEYTISQQPVAVAVQPMAMVPQALPKSLAPHNFLALSIFVSICFGITNIATLFCSVPAIVLSLLANVHNEQGQYKNGKLFSNLSVGFTTSAIFYGMLSFFIGFFITGLFNSYEVLCLSGEFCRFFSII